MRKIFYLIAIIGLSVCFVNAQNKKKTSKVPAQVKPSKILLKDDLQLASALGEIIGKTYRNKFFSFEIQFPDTWVIPDNDFESYMKKQGFNLEMQTPKANNQANQSKLNAAATKVSNLITTYKLLPGSADNAVFRISIENLETTPNVKDAVDYFDLMLETFKLVKLPKDLVISEVNAEKLGKMQFAFLNTSSKTGKKRMYATVINGFAVLFTLSYSLESDLETMKNILADGDFSLK